MRPWLASQLVNVGQSAQPIIEAGTRNSKRHLFPTTPPHHTHSHSRNDKRYICTHFEYLDNTNSRAQPVGVCRTNT